MTAREAVTVRLGWLPECSEPEVRSALGAAMPGLTVEQIGIRPRIPQPDPRYWSASATVDDRLVVKFAWSHVRAVRLHREGLLLGRLAARAPALRLPRLVTLHADPVVLVTEQLAGEPLSGDAGRDLLGPRLQDVARQLADLLVTLHGLPAAEVLRGLPEVTPTAQSDTAMLRARYGGLVDDGRAALVGRWCDWVDGVLGGPGPEDVLRRRSVTWIVSLATVGLVFDGYDLVVYGTVVPLFLRDPGQLGEVTPALAGALGSYALVGVLVGALLAGSVADVIGRRKVMLTAYAWFSVGMALTALAASTTTFGLLRFVTGIGVGALVATTGALVAVLDLEECGARDPHFDLRYLPGSWSSNELLLAVVAAYGQRSGTALSLERIMAWHVLTALGDARWRTEAGVELPGGGDARTAVDDVRDRFDDLGVPAA